MQYRLTNGWNYTTGKLLKWEQTEWVLTIDTNNQGGNFVQKHKAIEFDLVGEQSATKYYPNHLSRLKQVEKLLCLKSQPVFLGSSHNAQRPQQKKRYFGGGGGALRDEPKNGCEGVYKLNGANHLIFQAEFPVFPCKW